MDSFREISFAEIGAQLRKRVEEIQQNINNTYNIKFVQVADGNGDSMMLSECDVMGERLYNECMSVYVSKRI